MHNPTPTHVEIATFESQIYGLNCILFMKYIGFKF